MKLIRLLFAFALLGGGVSAEAAPDKAFNPAQYAEKVKSCPANDRRNCHLQIASEVAKDISDFRKQNEVMVSVGKQYIEAGRVDLADPLIAFVQDKVRAGGKDIKLYDRRPLNEFAVALAKVGELERVRRLRPYVYWGDQAYQPVAMETLRQLIKQGKRAEALAHASEYLSYNSGGPEFYKLLVPLNYAEFLKSEIPKEVAPPFHETEISPLFPGQERERAVNRAIRLPLIAVYDPVNYKNYDKYLPDSMRPEDKVGQYMIASAILQLMGPREASDYFYDKTIEEIKKLPEGELRMRVGMAFLLVNPALPDIDPEKLKELGVIVPIDIDNFRMHMIIAKGIEYAEKKKQLAEASQMLEQADQLYAANVINVPPEMYDSPPPPRMRMNKPEFLQGVHAMLVKKVVALMLENGKFDEAKAKYTSESEINNTLTEDEWYRLLLAAYLEKGHLEYALQTANMITNPDQKAGSFMSIAGYAEGMNNHAVLTQAIDLAMQSLGSMSENERNYTLNVGGNRAGGKAKNYKNYTLTKKLIAMGKPERQNGEYRIMVHWQVEKGDFEEAKKTLDLIKDEKELNTAREYIALGLAKAGQADQALQFITGHPGDEALYEIVRGYLKQDRAKAANVAATIKDPYYFAQANLALAE